MRRPLVPVAIFYAGGILLARNVEFSHWLSLAVACVLLVCALSWRRGRPLVLGAFIVCVGATGYGLHTAPLSRFDLRRMVGTNSVLATVRGRLTETPTARVAELDGKVRCVSRIEVKQVRWDGEESWRMAVGQVVVSTPGELTNWFRGEEVEVDRKSVV